MRAVADDLTLARSELGRLTISRDAVAEIVAETALALLRRRRDLRRHDASGGFLRREGISDRAATPTALRDRAARRRRARPQPRRGRATIRSQVAYEVERLTGLGVAAVEVVIQRVRQSHESARALELVRGARAAIEASRAPDRRPERLSGARRRHRART